jgi:hypothetical protein
MHFKKDKIKYIQKRRIMPKKYPHCFCVIFCFISAGCASLNSNVPFRYQPSLLAVTHTIDKTVAIEVLADSRPAKDIAYTKNITDVSQKITAKLLQDFKDSKLFKEIHYAVQENDDIVISGSINRFIWKLSPHPLSYVPLLAYFGTPTFRAEGLAAITLEVKDKKTGTVLATFQESANMANLFTVYNFKVCEGGTELEDAFRELGRKLKEDLLNKVNWR